MFVKFIALAGAACLLMGAQSAFQSAHGHCAAAQKSHAADHAGYVKPGAAVSLTHDYEGKTDTGAFETLTATVAHIYEDGALSVSLLAPPELQVSAFTPVQNMLIYPGSTLDLPIQFSGTENGNFTLSLEIVYVSPDGHQSRRVLSIPVNIGPVDIGKSTFQKSPLAAKALIETTSKTGVIALPAAEVIE